MPPTQEERLVQECFISYRHGWRDGASTRMQDQRFVTHPRAELGAAYMRGFTAGRFAWNQALKGEADRLGYNMDLAVLRASTEEEPNL